jgi:hypothetical protein
MNSQESKGMMWTGRILSGLVVLFMTMDGVMKLVQPKEVTEPSAKLGMEGSTLTAIGLVLLASTLLYAFKKTSVLGAVLLTAYLGGAVAVNVCFHQPVFNICFAIAFGIITWGGLFLRDERIRDLMPLVK